jgi:translation initiation factor 4E
MWEHKANTGGAAAKDPDKWKENMEQLCEFQTVEDYWRYFLHLPKPSDVFFDGDCRKMIGPEGKTVVEEYSLFKKGIEPEWGDPQNVTGGEWFCRQYFEKDVLDLYWQNLVMGCIGETIEDSLHDDNDNDNDNDENENDNTDKTTPSTTTTSSSSNILLQNHINGARVVDKSRHYPLYKLEIWVNTRDPIIKEKIKNKVIEVITEGQPSKKMQPKFDWRDHN